MKKLNFSGGGESHKRASLPEIWPMSKTAEPRCGISSSDINKNYYNHFLKKIERDPYSTLFVTFFIIYQRKNLLNENDIEFDCMISHVPVIFPFL